MDGSQVDESRRICKFVNVGTAHTYIFLLSSVQLAQNQNFDGLLNF